MSATHDEQLKEKIEAAFKKARKSAEATPSPSVAEVVESATLKFEGELMLSDLLRKHGFDTLANSLPYDVPATEYEEGTWTDLKVGAYIPDIEKFRAFMPEPLHISRMFLWLHKGWPLLFSGPPGTGKTTMCEFAAALMRQPFFRINYNGYLEQADLLGHMGVAGGDMEWVDGVLPIAMREGYVICNDEIFRAPPFVPLSMQGLMDKGGVLRLLGKHDDDVVHPDKRTRLVFTDNTKGTGDNIDRFSTAQVQDTSFINRIKGSIVVGYMPRDTEVASLCMEFPDVDEGEVAKLVQLAGDCRTAYLKGELSLVLSKRQLETVCDILPYVGKREALDVTYHASLPEDESGVFEELFNDTFGERW